MTPKTSLVVMFKKILKINEIVYKICIFKIIKKIMFNNKKCLENF